MGPFDPGHHPFVSWSLEFSSLSFCTLSIFYKLIDLLLVGQSLPIISFVGDRHGHSPSCKTSVMVAVKANMKTISSVTVCACEVLKSVFFQDSWRKFEKKCTRLSLKRFLTNSVARTYRSQFWYMRCTSI